MTLQMPMMFKYVVLVRAKENKSLDEYGIRKYEGTLFQIRAIAHNVYEVLALFKNRYPDLEVTKYAVTSSDMIRVEKLDAHEVEDEGEEWLEKEYVWSAWDGR